MVGTKYKAKKDTSRESIWGKFSGVESKQWLNKFTIAWRAALAFPKELCLWFKSPPPFFLMFSGKPDLNFYSQETRPQRSKTWNLKTNEAVVRSTKRMGCYIKTQLYCCFWKCLSLTRTIRHASTHKVENMHVAKWEWCKNTAKLGRTVILKHWSLDDLVKQPGGGTDNENFMHSRDVGRAGLSVVKARTRIIAGN